MDSQLPAGFSIRPFIDGPALYLGDRMVGSATPVAAGTSRVDLCVNTMAQRSRFISSIDVATDYLTRWCCSCEARIRALYPDADVTPGGFAHLATRKDPAAGDR